MITLKEIAEICNVSVSTVSNVLNGKSKASKETREMILKVVEEKGYQPNYMAQGLRKSRTRTIALIVDDIAQFTSPPMVESIMQYCEKHDYRVTMRNLRLYNRWLDTWQNQEAAFLEIVKPVLKDVLGARVDGIIYVASHTRVLHCFEQNFPVPVVVVHAFSGIPEMPSVIMDDESSAKEMAEYLLSHEHRKIGFIGGGAENYHTQGRLRGYQKALFEHEILYNPDLVFFGDWQRESGYLGARQLLKEGVTAIFCCSDKMAGGVYDYLEESGKAVGKDVAVTGFDDENIAAFFSPKLTTVRLPLAESGHKAAQVLLELLETTERTVPDEPQVYMIPCTFVERKSV